MLKLERKGRKTKLEKETVCATYDYAHMESVQICTQLYTHSQTSGQNAHVHGGRTLNFDSYDILQRDWQYTKDKFFGFVLAGH